MTSAYPRIRHALNAAGITPRDIETKVRALQSSSRGRPIAVDLQATQFGAQVVAAMLELVANAAIERAASVVDQCNHEGPYNAIGAASRIRALSGG